MMLTRALLREHERERQAWERERRLLIETICHLAGRSLPDVIPVPDYGTDRDELDAPAYVDPAQLPDY